MRFFLTLAVFVTLVPAARAQPKIDWTRDGRVGWFISTAPTSGGDSIRRVNLETRRCESGIDEGRLADSFSKLLGEEVAEQGLRIQRVRAGETPNEVSLLFRNRWYRFDCETYELTKEDRGVGGLRLFLPPRPSGASKESIEITVENQLADPIMLFWIASDRGQRRYATVAPNKSHTQHTYAGHSWLIKSEDNQPIGSFVAAAGQRVSINDEAVSSVRRERGRDRKSFARRPIRGGESPDRRFSIEVREHNLWLRKGEEEWQLSNDGSQENSYGSQGRPEVYWSSDSRHVVAMRTHDAPEREVFLIESSPKDQLQPKLDSYRYRKPGDELPVKSVQLFDVERRTAIEVSNELFENPWSLRFRGWSKASDRFYLHYNQRGHQVLRVLEVSVSDGRVRAIIEETSETFLQYSNGGKSVFEDLDEDQILWASERSGWNHLYRYSRSQGKLLGPVTVGDWNVKRIENIDRENGEIWFYAVGVLEDQDPYHEHLCRVNFDGSGFVILTEGDGTHKVGFEQDRKLLIDTWSRVDLAPITELRDARTGDLICELEREDAQTRFGDRRLTTRFVSKGRDGETDIWGILHWPKDFDPSETYPVVENIYAGPHDHHVPKSFRTGYRHQHQIADAGFIVVQIDGMGTAWRSKSFHDVCYKNLRDAGFPDRIAWMKAAAEQFPQMDITRVGIYGGSAGGQNAMAALLWHNDFYDVAVADCGCHDNRMDKIWWNEQWMSWPVDKSYEENSNTANAHLLEGDLMLIVGELDKNVDPASTTQVVHALVESDKDFEFVLVPGVGHGAAETPWASRKRLNFLKRNLLPK